MVTTFHNGGFWYILLVFNRTVVLILIFSTSVRTVVMEFQHSVSGLMLDWRVTSCAFLSAGRFCFFPQSLTADHTRPCSAPSHTAMQNHHLKEHLYKILVIGDLGVGKTSIIKRYVHQNFSPNYRATIGVDFALKVLNLDQETVRLQLWDIAGK